MLSNDQLNNIKFGNPNRQHLAYLETETYLNSLYNELSSVAPPPNYGEESSQEILALIRHTNGLKDNPDLLSRFLLYDNNFEAYIIKSLAESGLPEDDVKQLVIDIHKDILPLLVRLKYFYNRPRPQQLAFYKGLNLFVWKAVSADSPSYPSGHCFQSKIYAEVIGNRYPKYYKGLMELAEDIKWSRQYLGLHYNSDTEFGMYCAELVLKHPEFVKKYKL